MVLLEGGGRGGRPLNASAKACASPSAADMFSTSPSFIGVAGFAVDALLATGIMAPGPLLPPPPFGGAVRSLAKVRYSVLTAIAALSVHSPPPFSLQPRLEG